MLRDIQGILDLKTDESIGEELAQRQMEVIKRSYQYLSRPENNVIYIGDEVGLGKTYIGIGIALLLRYHSKAPLEHGDFVIVPKSNLQIKWQKAYSSFLDHNYLPEDTIKTNLENQIEISPDLRVFDPNNLVNIVRATSFSYLATPRESSDLKDHLQNTIFASDPFSREILGEAKKREYFRKENAELLRRLVACLLNAANPKISCLIVDEAHNYKHGTNTALRNKLTSRYLGAVKDEDILQDFPQLRYRMKFPLAEKIICLSATPKDRDLMEVRGQFNCFSDRHILQEAKSAPDVAGALAKFLIRGNLNYHIAGKTQSRNQCRLEHRKGNINKVDDAQPLVLKDNFEAVCWQLLQYKSLKHLNAKNNAQFEIGMLAGFESYQLDVQKRSEKKPDEEYVMVVDGVSNRSEDYDVVKRMIEDYKKRFEGRLPPHPKQTQMEREIGRQMTEAEKSLIFVRRVASAEELGKRLMHQYEYDVVYRKQILALPASLQRTSPMANLTNIYVNRTIEEKLPLLFDKLVRGTELRTYFREQGLLEEEQQMDRLRHAFYHNEELAVLIKTYFEREQINLSSDLRKTALKALVTARVAFESDSTIDDDIPEDEKETGDDPGGYFFAYYFSKEKLGKRYINKTYREPWFDIDLLAFNHRLPFLSFDEQALEAELKTLSVTAKMKKQRIFQDRQNKIVEFLTQYGVVALQPDGNSEETTFLTLLLTGACQDLMRRWLEKRAYKSVASVLDDLRLLGGILKNIFRNGSGRLAGFVADASGGDFNAVMSDLVVKPDAIFGQVLQEVRTIIADFDLLVTVNFGDRKLGFINTTLQKANAPVAVVTGNTEIRRDILATQFRMPGFPYVLVTTDILKEGEDLHTYCQNVYHYGIAWNPSDMEQRTGRIDRINSLSYRKLISKDEVHFDNKIHVFYPYLPQSVEINQVARLLKNIDDFTTTFNNVEENRTYVSKIAIDESIEESGIPKQIDTFVESKYDVWGFDTGTE